MCDTNEIKKGSGRWLIQSCMRHSVATIQTARFAEREELQCCAKGIANNSLSVAEPLLAMLATGDIIVYNRREAVHYICLSNVFSL